MSLREVLVELREFLRYSRKYWLGSVLGLGEEGGRDALPGGCEDLGRYANRLTGKRYENGGTIVVTRGQLQSGYRRSEGLERGAAVDERPRLVREPLQRRRRQLLDRDALSGILLDGDSGRQVEGGRLWFFGLARNPASLTSGSESSSSDL